MRYSNGAVSLRDLDTLDPHDVSEWASAFEWLIRKEYPDK
jgi:hypothetical protein